MAWSTCLPGVLAKCFRSQQDYIDNSAAACVCTSWRDTFRDCAAQIKIQQNPLNEALLSPTYLRQFEGLHTVDLRLATDRPQQSVAGRWLGSWLRDAVDTPQSRGAYVQRCTQTMQSIPSSCCWLRLDGFPSVPTSVGALSQLSNLSSLHLQSRHHCNVFMEDFAHLLQLQSLSLVGHKLRGITLHSSLRYLPAGITTLQFKYCHKQGMQFFYLPFLSHLCELRTLDMSSCNISFSIGEGSGVANLRNIKVLVLDSAEATEPQSVVASLMTATQLQELSLRRFAIVGEQHEAQLGPVLTALSSLQKLDVTYCCHVVLGPAEYTQLRLHSFACDYSQLNIVEAVPFKAFATPFPTREGITVWPSLQIAGQFAHFEYQHWIDTLPMTALTLLTMHMHGQCPCF